MTDMDKLRIKPLQDEADYDLWKIRIDAILRAQGLSDAMYTEDASEMSAEEDRDGQKKREKASAIIVVSLGDKALRVVRNVTSNPAQMLTKLDERYNSKTTASKISKMAELVSLQYSDRKEDIRTHIDRMDGLIEELKGMALAIDDTMAIGILVASIKVSKLAPVVAAIKTIPDEEVKWDTVSARLIEDWKDLPMVKEETTFSARVACEFCGRYGHEEHNCKYKKQYLKKNCDDSDDAKNDSTRCRTGRWA